MSGLVVAEGKVFPYIQDMKACSAFFYFLAVLFLVPTLVLAGAPGEAQPALHKALYNLKMVSVGSGSGIVGISGEMYFDLDDTCDAWTTDQRFTTEYQYAESRSVENTNHYVAWEAKDGSQFQFNSERQENGETVEQLRGSARRADDSSGKAEYTKPDGKNFSLAKGYFLPTAHVMEVVRRARAGENFFNAVMFDGTDAEGPVEVNTIIGKKITPYEIKEIINGGEKGKIDEALLTGEAWHARLAFFPVNEKEEMNPSYEMDVVLHANGIISHALIDYKTFKLEQKLHAVEKMPSRTCQQEKTP